MTSDDGAVFLSTLPARSARLRGSARVRSDLRSREKREFFERTGAPYLTKPFDLREVRQLVHRMLTETGGASDHR
jgi:DNA-binding response OmpR family regulator